MHTIITYHGRQSDNYALTLLTNDDARPLVTVDCANDYCLGMAEHDEANPDHEQSHFDTEAASHALALASVGQTLFAAHECQPDGNFLWLATSAEAAAKTFLDNFEHICTCEDQNSDEPYLRKRLGTEAARIAAAFVADPSQPLRLNSDFDPAASAERRQWFSLESSTWSLLTIDVIAPLRPVVIATKSYDTKAA